MFSLHNLVSLLHVGEDIILALQNWDMRLRELKSLVQGHRARKWWNKDWISGLSRRRQSLTLFLMPRLFLAWSIARKHTGMGKKLRLREGGGIDSSWGPADKLAALPKPESGCG